MISGADGPSSDTLGTISASGDFPLVTFPEALHQAIDRHPDRVALRTLDDSARLTWAQYGRRVEQVAGALGTLGVTRGDTVALMMSNRIEFHEIDAAAVCLGATPFSVYNTNPPEAIRYVVADSGARVAVIESAALPNFLTAVEELPAVERIVVIDATGPFEDPRVVSLASLEGAAPEGFDFTSTWKSVQLDDVLTLVYTSGTTGPPRGVELTHLSIMQTAFALADSLPPPDGASVVSSLPMAHVAERLHSQYLSTLAGFTITVCPNIRELLDHVQQVHPNWWFAPPRMWQKFKSAIESWVTGEPDAARKAALEQAVEAGLKKVRLEQSGQPVGDEIATAADDARELFQPLLARLGLDQLKSVLTGSAPCPPEILEFFAAIGLPIYECWGLTECGSFGTINGPWNWRIGTTGTVMPGMELKIAEDGEILLRGKANMLRYRNLPDVTANTIDEDGWLHSGDIGELTPDGFLRLTDRKKELIINAAGKNMSPAHIEAILKAECPLVDQICAVGNGKPYNVALITLDVTAVSAAAKQLGLEATDVQTLAQDSRILAQVEEGVQRGNARLSRVEQIKRYTVLPTVWEPAGEELTPTMKLRRRPITEKYSTTIEAMYD